MLEGSVGGGLGHVQLVLKSPGGGGTVEAEVGEYLAHGFAAEDASEF